jgi:hypothetical protein
MATVLLGASRLDALDLNPQSEPPDRELGQPEEGVVVRVPDAAHRRLDAGFSEPEYPYHDKSVRVTHCGRICVGRRKINLSTVFAGQVVGIREVEDQIWLVSFLDFDLGFFDQEQGRAEPAPNPFVPEKLLPMSPE